MSGVEVPEVRRIVVGVDGSESSAAALRWAVRQAELTGDAVDAVIAWHIPASYGPYGYAYTPVIDYAGLAKTVLSETIEKAVIQGTSVDVRQHVVEGNPARVLLDAAAGADLLVVGSRGHGGFTEMLLGSVGQHCVHHAPCPVVVIRSQEHK